MKKGKFDLGEMVAERRLWAGQEVFFVANPKLSAKVIYTEDYSHKGSWLLQREDRRMSVHQFACICLGMDPPDHATKWLRTESGTTLYDLWHAEEPAPVRDVPEHWPELTFREALAEILWNWQPNSDQRHHQLERGTDSEGPYINADKLTITPTYAEYKTEKWCVSAETWGKLTKLLDCLLPMLDDGQKEPKS